MIALLFLWTVNLALLGLWKVCNEKGQPKDRLCLLTGIVLIFLRYLPVSIFNYAGSVVCLVLGFFVLIGKLLGFL